MTPIEGGFQELHPTRYAHDKGICWDCNRYQEISFCAKCTWRVCMNCLKQKHKGIHTR